MASFFYFFLVFLNDILHAFVSTPWMYLSSPTSSQFAGYFQHWSFPSSFTDRFCTCRQDLSSSLIFLSQFLVTERMNRPGDWNCRSCHHLNFQRRDSCQRCGDSRIGAGELGSFSGARGNGSSFGFSTGSDVRPGDWYCAAGNCGTHNFASRSSCFKCGAFKDDHLTGGGFDCDLPRSRGFGFGSSGGRSGWKSGDWICGRLGCNEHNFASRMECFRCSAPRDSTARPY